MKPNLATPGRSRLDGVRDLPSKTLRTGVQEEATTQPTTEVIEDGRRELKMAHSKTKTMKSKWRGGQDGTPETERHGRR